MILVLHQEDWFYPLFPTRITMILVKDSLYLSLPTTIRIMVWASSKSYRNEQQNQDLPRHDTIQYNSVQLSGFQVESPVVIRIGMHYIPIYGPPADPFKVKFSFFFFLDATLAFYCLCTRYWNHLSSCLSSGLIIYASARIHLFKIHTCEADVLFNWKLVDIL